MGPGKRRGRRGEGDLVSLASSSPSLIHLPCPVQSIPRTRFTRRELPLEPPVAHSHRYRSTRFAPSHHEDLDRPRLARRLCRHGRCPAPCQRTGASSLPVSITLARRGRPRGGAARFLSWRQSAMRAFPRRGGPARVRKRSSGSTADRDTRQGGGARADTTHSLAFRAARAAALPSRSPRRARSPRASRPLTSLVSVPTLLSRARDRTRADARPAVVFPPSSLTRRPSLTRSPYSPPYRPLQHGDVRPGVQSLHDRQLQRRRLRDGRGPRPGRLRQRRRPDQCARFLLMHVFVAAAGRLTIRPPPPADTQSVTGAATGVLATLSSVPVASGSSAESAAGAFSSFVAGGAVSSAASGASGEQLSRRMLLNSRARR